MNNQSLPIHPAAELFPLLTNKEYQALLADIKVKGLLDPIVIYQGQILDGRHRYRACIEANIEPVCREWEGGDSPTGYVISKNLHHRHLTTQQRAALALDAKKMFAEEAKERQLATLKQNQNTDTQKIGERTLDDKHAGESAQQAAALFGTNRQYVTDVEKLSEEAPDLFEQVKTGEKTIPESNRELKKRKREMQRQQSVTITNDAIKVGDMRVLGDDIPAASVDLIFTDPPYGNKHIQDYEALAALAARVLKPGGSLLCYCGQSVLHKILPVMIEQLTYHWIIAMQHSGPIQRFPGKWVFIGWKPILWFTRGPRRDETFITDFIKSQPDKAHHEWGQGIEEALYYIEQLTQPGELVLDPFMGGGTTCLAAKQLQRRYLAFEIDPATANQAIVRLADGDH